jgi:ribosome biogenesis GTPase / thiamine phosphate phosphatase
MSPSDDAPPQGDAPDEPEPLLDEDTRIARTRERLSQRRRRSRRPAGSGPPTAVVVEMVGKWVRVRHADGATTRHKVRAPVVVGDEIAIEDDEVVGFAPRRTELRRGGNSGIRVVCANADVLVIVTASTDPPFRPGLVDRMLVAASAGEMDAAIVLNKCDLGMPEEVLERIARYEALDVPCFLLSAAQDKGIEALREHLAGQVSVLAGHSGVGKSTLLRALIPGVQRDTGTLDEWGRGRHTTTGACAFELPGGGAVVDLPGVREYGIEFVLREELRTHFPELAELPCKYADCVHLGEDGCVADELVVDEDRLASYRKLLDELV